MFVVSIIHPLFPLHQYVSLLYLKKSVPLWYLKQQGYWGIKQHICCDLLENQYLCGI